MSCHENKETKCTLYLDCKAATLPVHLANEGNLGEFRGKVQAPYFNVP